MRWIPERLLIGRQGLYVSTNLGDTITEIPAKPKSSNSSKKRVTALAYGGWDESGQANPDVIYVARGNTLSLLTDSANESTKASDFVSVTIDTASTITGIVLDPSNWKIAYVTDGPRKGKSHVYRVEFEDGELKETSITGNLKERLLNTVEIVKVGGHDVVLVGGSLGVYRSFDPKDENAVWTEFGAGLPNVPVRDIEYNSENGVLLAATLGRGAWVVNDANEYLAEESAVLLYGTDGEDSATLVLDSDNPLFLKIEDENQELIDRIPVASIEVVDMEGGDGSDSLTVDNTYGAITLSGGISYEGGDDDQTDTLIFNGIAPIGVTETSASDLAGFIEIFAANGTQLVTYTGIESPTNNLPAPEAVDATGGGLQTVSDWSEHWSQLFEFGLPLWGGSLGRALNGASPDESPAITDLEEEESGLIAETSDGAESSSDSILSRIFESDESGFLLSDIGRSITNLADLESKLSELGTLTKTPTDEGTEFALEIEKDLKGKVDLEVEGTLLGASASLSGYMEIQVHLTLFLRFGVDANGFYIRPDPDRDELVIANIHVNGQVEASGWLGFLGVELTEASLDVDPAIVITVNLKDPGTEADDGIIRLGELSSVVTDLVEASIDGDSSADDVVFTGTFTAGAYKADGEPAINLANVKLSLIWADRNDVTSIRVSAATDVNGQSLLDFLLLDPTEALAQLKQWADWLAQFRETNVFDLSIPFSSGTTVGEAFDVSKAFLDQIYSQVVGVELVSNSGSLALS
jgi:hypothetical protein